MARWPLQLRFRQGKAFNLGTQRRRDKPAALYKRAFFVDWRSADRLKTQLMPRIDWVIDGNEAMQPRMVSGAHYRAALNTIARRPFRVRPFFDPGPWGGQWMRQTFGLPEGPANYAWCFDCVPEQHSLLLGFGDQAFEAPAIDAVLIEPERLLGEEISSRSGAEFTVRARASSCWGSAPRPTSTPSSSGTGVAWGSTASRGPSISITASPTSPGSATPNGRGANWSTLWPPLPMAKAGARSVQACMRCSSSKPAATGSTQPSLMTRAVPSTYSTWSAGRPA